MFLELCPVSCVDLQGMMCGWCLKFFSVSRLYCCFTEQKDWLEPVWMKTESLLVGRWEKVLGLCVEKRYVPRHCGVRMGVRIGAFRIGAFSWEVCSRLHLGGVYFLTISLTHLSTMEFPHKIITKLLIFIIIQKLFRG